MGYSTDFEGKLKFNKQLSLDDKVFLEKLAITRRMARRVGSEYGVEGEFYVEGDGSYGPDSNIIDHNTPPKTQPGLWLQWIPTEDGWGLEWDLGEKFYNYVEWLEYLIERVLKPRGYVLNGSIDWSGEESVDIGRIVVKDNKVTTLSGNITYNELAVHGDVTRVFFVTDGPIVDDDNFQHEELHETLEEAERYAKDMTNPRIRVCIVRNAYREAHGGWNYDDYADTFETIKVLDEEWPGQHSGISAMAGDDYNKEEK